MKLSQLKEIIKEEVQLHRLRKLIREAIGRTEQSLISSVITALGMPKDDVVEVLKSDPIIRGQVKSYLDGDMDANEIAAAVAQKLGIETAGHGAHPFSNAGGRGMKPGREPFSRAKW